MQTPPIITILDDADPNAEVSPGCPICLEDYDVGNCFPVISPECGHSICYPCANRTKSHICAVCQSRSFYSSFSPNYQPGTEREWRSHLWKKNFALLDVIEEHASVSQKMSEALKKAEREKETEERARENAEKERKAEKTARENAEEEKKAERAAREQAELEKEAEKKAKEKAEDEKEEEKAARERAEEEKKALTEELEKLKEEQNAVERTTQPCSSCNTREKRERLKLCMQCAQQEQVELKNSEEIDNFVYCCFCAQEKHGQHKMVKYVEWKIDSILKGSIHYGETSMDKTLVLSKSELEMSENGIKQWMEYVRGFINCKEKLDLETCSTLEMSIKTEADAVVRATNDTLPVFKKWRDTVEESVVRLKRLADQMSGEGETEKAKEVEMVGVVKEENPEPVRSSARKRCVRRRLGE